MSAVGLGISNRRIMNFTNNKHKINLSRSVKSGAKSKNISSSGIKQDSYPLLSIQSTVDYCKLRKPHH